MTIATIISISGQAWARDEAGNLRELRVGDTLQEGETLVTSDNGRVELVFADGLDPTVIDGGQEVVMTPDLDVEQPVAAEEASAQDEDLEALLTAIDEGEGDLLEDLDATAAGAGGAGGEGGGHDFVRLARITENVNPLSYEYGLASLGGIPEVEGQAVEEPAPEDEPDSFPTVDTIDLDGDGDTVWESALPEGSGGGTLTTSGMFQIDTGIDLLALIEVQDAEGNWIAVGAEGSTIAGEYGTLTVNPDGSWSYTLDQSIDHPVQGETGEADQLADTFAVRVTDDDGDVSAPATLVIAITDDGPAAANDTVGQIPEDGSVDIDVFANDTAGADGVDLATGIAVATGPSKGAVVYNGDGTFTYTAAPGAEGADSFSYTITDADGDTATATVSLSLGADSTPTVTVADASVDETGGLDADTQAFSTTYGNDSAGTLALSAAGATWDASTSTLTADNGDWQIVVNDDGTYTVTQLQAMTHPDASDPNDAVTVTVTADITDNEGDPAQDTFTVTFLDDGPVAANDVVTEEVAEDGSVDIDVFANDTAGTDGVDLATGIAVATGPSKGAVVYNGDGTFTYTAAPGAEGADSFSYTITDADGDTATATVSLSIGEDSTPVVTSVIDMLVDEDNLEGGLADAANGDDDQVLTGTISFDTGRDALQDIALASNTSGLTTLDGDAVSFAWDAGTGTLVGYTGDTAPTEDGYDPSNTVVTVTLDASQYAAAVGSTGTGSVDYTVALFQPLAHPPVDTTGEPTDAFENNLAFTVDVTLTDADGDTAPASSFTVDIDDDMPAQFYPQSGHVLLAVNSDAPTEQTVTQSLNFLAGADGLGDIVFNLDLVNGQQAFLSVDGDQLYLNNEPLFLQYTEADDPSSIQAVTDSGDVGFTATIDAEGNVTYTIFSGSILTDSKITSVTDLSGIGGGNVPFKGLNIGSSNSPDPDGTDDILVSSEILPLDDADQGTVNSTSSTLGVGQGAEVSGSEVLRYDLVRNLSIDDTNNAESYSFDGYQQTNVFSQKIEISGDSKKEASFELRIYSMGLEGSATGESSSLVSGPGGEGQLALTAEEVKIYDENGVEQQGYVTTNGDGSVLVQGMKDGWTFEIVSVDDNFDPEAFNAVEIQGVELDGGADTSFKLGEFSYGEEPSFSPVTFELPVTGSDADGDSLDSQVAITVYPDSESIVGDAQGNELSGTSGDDSLFGLEGDDTLTGGQGDDVLAGGLGADTFAWSFADDGGDQGTEGSPAVDLVTDFNLNEVGEGDVLRLNDLLPETGSDVGSYIHAIEDGEGNTLLHISSNGAFDGVFDANVADQIIALNGVSMEGADSSAFIQSLIDEGQLDIE